MNQGNQLRPNVITKKFLGLWGPATYFCCCDRFTLSMGMSAITIYGMVSSTFSAVRSIVIMALGHWFGIMGVIVSIIEISFFWMGNRGAALFDARKVRTFFYFIIIYSVMSLIRAWVSEDAYGDAEFFRFFSIFLILVHLYIVYAVWSFLVRLETCDFDTLRYGPRRDATHHSQLPTVVQGQVVQVQGQNQGGPQIQDARIIANSRGVPVGGGQQMGYSNQGQQQVEIAMVNVGDQNGQNYGNQNVVYGNNNDIAYGRGNYGNGTNTNNQGSSLDRNNNGAEPNSNEEDLSIFGAPKRKQ
eukprot:CAMPEP_0115002294 /NCGR_PEP_ID=MMETSP0216-20121206/17911_1 /TAXON_ID=223996 /ORGANISM="Protocruzia adherens, Strain Boccale" /LENGTH=299 /DNA_ID=CAMNT_0002367843 /DNA_START=174 /DNA_END=1073 /DNA_ORIENTATION=-